MKPIDVINKTFGELLVLEDFSKVCGNTKRRFLKCKCSCGNIVVINKSKVLQRKTLSCGHLQKEMRKNLGKLNKLPYGEATFNETYECYKKMLLSVDMFLN